MDALEEMKKVSAEYFQANTEQTDMCMNELTARHDSLNQATGIIRSWNDESLGTVNNFTQFIDTFVDSNMKVYMDMDTKVNQIVFICELFYNMSFLTFAKLNYNIKMVIAFIVCLQMNATGQKINEKVVVLKNTVNNIETDTVSVFKDIITIYDRNQEKMSKQIDKAHDANKTLLDVSIRYIFDAILYLFILFIRISVDYGKNSGRRRTHPSTETGHL